MIWVGILLIDSSLMNVNSLLETLDAAPESLEFADVMQTIESNYSYTPVKFSCGDAVSEAGSNEGSCKILAFAKMHNVSAEKTPWLFGRYYREDVLNHPDGQDHANIRNFIKSGWSGVSFEQEPLQQILSLIHI